MIKAMLKTIGVAGALILAPILLLIVWAIFTIVGPIVGVLALIFLPMIFAGVIIGYSEGKKDKGDE